MVENVVDTVGYGVWREKIDEKAVFPILDDLGDRCRIRADHQTSRGHRFQHRPREYEGHGQIYVDRRDLKDFDKVVVGHLAEEMDPPGIDFDFGEYALAPAIPLGQLGAVADAVGADDEAPGSWGAAGKSHRAPA